MLGLAVVLAGWFKVMKRRRGIYQLDAPTESWAGDKYDVRAGVLRHLTVDVAEMHAGLVRQSEIVCSECLSILL